MGIKTGSNQVEAEMDRNLESKLAFKLSGIFNWALEGYNRLKKNGFSLKDVPSLNFAKQEYRNNVDTVRAIVAERLIKSNNSEDRLKFSEAYKQYTSFCEREGRKDIEDKKSFKKVLKELGFEIGNSSKDGNQIYIFNVRFISGDEEA